MIEICDVQVDKNVFDILLVVRLDGLECGIELQQLTVQQLSGVRVDLTGFSVLNPLGRRVAQFVVDFFHAFIRDVAESYAREMVNSAVRSKTLVHRLLGYGISGVVDRVRKDTSSTSGSRDSQRAIVQIIVHSCCQHHDSKCCYDNHIVSNTF